MWGIHSGVLGLFIVDVSGNVDSQSSGRVLGRVGVVRNCFCYTLHSLCTLFGAVLGAHLLVLCKGPPPGNVAGLFVVSTAFVVM